MKIWKLLVNIFRVLLFPMHCLFNIKDQDYNNLFNIKNLCAVAEKLLYVFHGKS